MVAVHGGGGLVVVVAVAAVVVAIVIGVGAAGAEYGAAGGVLVHCYFPFQSGNFFLDRLQTLFNRLQFLFKA